MNSFGKDNVARRALLGLACLAMLLMAAGASHAASGSALINGFRGQWTSGSNYLINYLEITNVSDSTATVKVTLYKQDGTVITDDGSSSSGYITSVDPGSSYNDNLTGATVSFDLAAHKTTYLEVRATSSSLVHGYGLIEWTSSGQAPTAIMAYGGSVSYVSSQYTSWSAPYFINGGRPF